MDEFFSLVFFAFLLGMLPNQSGLQQLNLGFPKSIVQRHLWWLAFALQVKPRALPQVKPLVSKPQVQAQVLPPWQEQQTMLQQQN
jgi:hypothetical protein